MKIRIPPKAVREDFHLTHELEGARKAVDVLTEYYEVPTMIIVLDGRKVGRGNEADYFENVAFFTKKGLKKRNVLHELYHHIVENKGVEMEEKEEERKAGLFAREVIKKCKKD